MDEPRVMFIDIPSVAKSRSVSPISPSRYRERSVGFFDMISRRFAGRSHDELCFHNAEEDSRSSSTDSCSSTSGHLAVISKSGHNSNLELNCSTSSTSESSGSESADNTNNKESRIHHHRRSSSSIRRALESLSLSSRSLSCSSTPSKETKTSTKKCKNTPPPKRILRQPVSYVYLKGISGLPTQRVPRSSVCCHYAHR